MGAAIAQARIARTGRPGLAPGGPVNLSVLLMWCQRKISRYTMRQLTIQAAALTQRRVRIWSMVPAVSRRVCRVGVRDDDGLVFGEPT